MAKTVKAKQAHDRENQQMQLSSQGRLTGRKRDGGGQIQRPNLPASSPFALMRQIVTEMDRFADDVWFNRPGGMSLTSTPQLQAWLPDIEVQQKDGNLLVAADLPGMDREGIEVTVTDGKLVIEGERSNESERDEQGFYRSERRYGHFQRVIPLPEGADTANTKARFENGVLKVTIPLPEQHRLTQQIKVE